MRARFPVVLVCSLAIGVALGLLAWFGIELFAWIYELLRAPIVSWQADAEEGGGSFWPGVLEWILYLLDALRGLAGLLLHTLPMFLLLVLACGDENPLRGRLPRTLAMAALALAFAAGFWVTPYLLLRFDAPAAFWNTVVTYSGMRWIHYVVIPSAGLLGALGVACCVPRSDESMQRAAG